jgi:hypothetical protein
MNAYKDVPNNKISMTLETFKKCLSSVPTYVDIHFTGYVEAFLNAKTPEMILHAHEKGHRISINTTLMGMTEKKFDKISHIPFKNFRVHLPSGTFKEKIGWHSKSIVEDGYTKTLNPKWIKMLDYVIEKGNTIMKTKPSYHSHGLVHGQLKELGYSDRLRIQETAQIQTRVQNVGDSMQERDPKTKLPPHLSPRGRCIRVYHNVLVPSGQVQLCCQDYGLEMTIGNLLDNTLEEIQNSPKFKEILKDGHDICDYCDNAVLDLTDKSTWGKWRKKKDNLKKKIKSVLEKK